MIPKKYRIILIKDTTIQTSRLLAVKDSFIICVYYLHRCYFHFVYKVSNNLAIIPT